MREQQARTEMVTASVVDRLEGLLPSMLDRVVGQWIGHARHELRQPLVVIAAALDALRAAAASLDEQMVPTLLAVAHRQAQLMQRILDQLEHAHRIHSGDFEVHPEPVDLRRVVDDVIADYGPLLASVDIDRRLPEQRADACVEPEAGREILLVLLRNAVDHAPCERPVVLEVVREGDTAEIRVHDDGAGVAPDDRRSIFARGRTLGPGGTLGLGLFVARGLARAHAGDVLVDDSPLTGGACFTLRLPSDCPPPTSSP